MYRRTFLRQVIIGTGIVWLMPSCVRNGGGQAGGETAMMDKGQLELLAELADTIIPKTDVPGAKELNVQHFVMEMVSNCRPDDYREKFLAGLEQFEQYCLQKTGRTFTAGGYEERLSLLKGVSKDKEASEDIKTLVSGVRELTIRGYANSQYVMTGPVPYELVPGRFRGCVKVTNKTS